MLHHLTGMCGGDVRHKLVKNSTLGDKIYDSVTF